MGVKPLELRLGAFAPDIHTQLKEQGLEADPNAVEHWQLDADSINRLRIRGMLTDAESHKTKRLGDNNAYRTPRSHLP